MNRDFLFNDLKALVEDFIEHENYVAHSQGQIQLEGYFWSSSERGLAILDEVKKYPDLEIFNNKFQQFGSTATKVSFHYLVHWIIESSFIWGVSEALNRLREYVHADSVNIYQVMPLHNLSIGHEIIDSVKFINGVELMRVFDVPNREFASHFSGFTRSLIGQRPYWTLILPFVQKKHHCLENEPLHRIEVPIEKLEDVQRCISLFCERYSLQPTCHAVLCNSVSPFVGPSLITYQMLPCQTSMPTQLTCSIAKLTDFFEKFNELELSSKIKLRVAIDRLNNFNSTSSLVDRAIDLRVSLESMFDTDPGKSGIKNRVVNEAGRIFGTDDLAREDAKAKIKMGYEYASTAVHEGKIEAEMESFLLDVATLVREAILKKVTSQ